MPNNHILRYTLNVTLLNLAQKPIREYYGKKLIYEFLPEFDQSFKHSYKGKAIHTSELKKGIKLPNYKTGYVAKPDELFGKRGKNGLVFLSQDKREVEKWIRSKAGKSATINQNGKKITGILITFLIEPLIPHQNEYYLAIKTFRDHDTLYFSAKGGVDVEENWKDVLVIEIPFRIDGLPIKKILETRLNQTNMPDNVGQIISFISGIYQVFKKLDFTYLEINPFVFYEGQVHMLDLVARLDDTAWYKNHELWSRAGIVEFPAQFGTNFTPSEEKIAVLDSKSGASLKFKILNPNGRIWLLTSGGGGSVIFADTVGDLGFHTEIANYSDYSGNPNTDETREFCDLMFEEMLKSKTKRKVLIIGGGIANFTDVAKTFTGVAQAIEKHAKKFKQQKVKVFIRRGGPNYKAGLENMKTLGNTSGIEIEAYGPEMYMTEVVKLALKS